MSRSDGDCILTDASRLDPKDWPHLCSAAYEELNEELNDTMTEEEIERYWVNMEKEQQPEMGTDDTQYWSFEKDKIRAGGLAEDLANGVSVSRFSDGSL